MQHVEMLIMCGCKRIGAYVRVLADTEGGLPAAGHAFALRAPLGCVPASRYVLQAVASAHTPGLVQQACRNLCLKWERSAAKWSPSSTAVASAFSHQIKNSVMLVLEMASMWQATPQRRAACWMRRSWRTWASASSATWPPSSIRGPLTRRRLASLRSLRGAAVKLRCLCCSPGLLCQTNASTPAYICIHRVDMHLSPTPGSSQIAFQQCSLCYQLLHQPAPGDKRVITLIIRSLVNKYGLFHDIAFARMRLLVWGSACNATERRLTLICYS